jgi:hypothetical protein
MKVPALIVGALLGIGIGCAKSDTGPDDARVGAPVIATTTTAGSYAPLATCNRASAAECTELFSFGLLGSDGERNSCEARGGTYALGGTCDATELLVGICAEQRTRILPQDKGGLHATIYTYEVRFDQGTNRVQAQGFGKRACEKRSGTWTGVSPTPAPRTPSAKAAVQ